MGIPWIPASWRVYAMYPSVMQLFWERLEPATQTESFLEDAMPSAVRAATIAITGYCPIIPVPPNTASFCIAFTACFRDRYHKQY
ncbi:MAG TPA: halocarboxylic acid dehydrogenase DehI family protein [Coleofasciculaceae cyanobacterium]